MNTLFSHRPRRIHSAFTVIELLVVIGVIAILLILTFPVLEKVNASRMNAGCVSNLRQLLTATSFYLGDHEMTYPKHYNDALASGDRVKQWFLPLIGYPNAPYQIAPYATTYVQHGGYGVKKAPFFCMKNPSFKTSGQQAWTNYAMNLRLLGKRAATLSSSKVLFFDANYSNAPALRYVTNGPGSAEWSRYIPVHGRFSNFAFTDGHVEAIYVSGNDSEAPSPKILADWF